MAQRRMFSPKVIDTDEFMEMPDSAQNLYFHMGMRADDDGFLSNPKRIMKMLGSAEDNLKILIAKRFIIPFESGVIVIRHWRIHNLIRSDRYTETDCKKEKKMLDEIDGKYALKKPIFINDIPNGNQLEPQVRLGKVSTTKENDEISTDLSTDLSTVSEEMANNKENLEGILSMQKF